MGYGLQVEIDCQHEDPPEYLHWSSKGMLDALAMGYELFGFSSILDKVAQKLDLDVTPLHKVTNPELLLEDFIEGIDPNADNELSRWKQRFREFEDRRRNAWQTPAEIRTCIDKLAKELDDHPAIFEEVGVDPDPYGNYVLSGDFRRELDKLLQIVVWAEENNISKLRLIWS